MSPSQCRIVLLLQVPEGQCHLPFSGFSKLPLPWLLIPQTSTSAAFNSFLTLIPPTFQGYDSVDLIGSHDNPE